MKLKKTHLFLLAMLIGIGITVAYLWVTGASNRPKIVRQVDSTGIYLTDQIRATDFRQIKRLHVATIVDMRPDGEARDQISSKEVEAISQQQGMTFAYIPVPHGAIPAPAVDRLSEVLRDGKRPILLYCRTGRRAIRTYCLAEASRKEGHSEAELASIAKESGFSIDDLHAELQHRIVARKTQ